MNYKNVIKMRIYFQILIDFCMTTLQRLLTDVQPFLNKLNKILK